MARQTAAPALRAWIWEPAPGRGDRGQARRIAGPQAARLDPAMDPDEAGRASRGGGRMGRPSRRLGSRGIPEGIVVSWLWYQLHNPHSRRGKHPGAHELQAMIREWRPGCGAPSPAPASQAGLVGRACRDCCGVANEATAVTDASRSRTRRIPIAPCKVKGSTVADQASTGTPSCRQAGSKGHRAYTRTSSAISPLASRCA